MDSITEAIVEIRRVQFRNGVECNNKISDPWDSKDAEVQRLLTALVQPGNLAAIECWAKGIGGMNPSAQTFARRALAEVRRRAGVSLHGLH